MRWRLLLVLAFALALRLPFLNQAIQGDDVNYLAGAEHAQIDPAHPGHARYAFLGKVVDMRGHPHPPLNAWCLAGLLALAGDVYEIPFHAAYIVFTLVAAAAMWSLARRFSPRPLPATLLFLATPAFVVNGGSLESDLPLTACWMAAAALFVRAVDGRSGRLLAGAAAALALTALAAYQSIVIVPILAAYLWMERRDWRAAWLVVAVPALVLALWQLFERLSTGALPATVLAGYMQSYNLQTIAGKLRNTAALTAHLAWLVFPALAIAASRRMWVAGLAAAAAGAFIDPHPMFWASFGVGVMLLAWIAGETPFLRAWVLIFFAAALALFFAGSARYLLPLAAPVALLVSRQPRLWAAFALQLALSLALAVVNYQHWDGYRRFAQTLPAEKRVWVNGEWGLRYYLESEGALPLLEGQAVRPGEIVVSSALAYPIPFTTGGGRLESLQRMDITSPLPLRMIGLGARSAWSTATLGLRPFDLSRAVIDRVEASIVVERKPTLEYLPMSAPEADSQIVSGVYKLEENRYRWMSGRAVFLLKPPAGPTPVEVSLYVPGGAVARRIVISVDGLRFERALAPGSQILSTPPVTGANLVLEVDRTFSTPGDQRQLGVILAAVGFRTPPRPD